MHEQLSFQTKASSVLVFLILALALSLALSSGQAESAAQFFEGKTIRVILFSGPGGGTDTYARLLARHMPRHIPGNPTAIVQNMPGGGGVIATNYVYNRAPRDGTVFGLLHSRSYILQAIKAKGLRADFSKMRALGSLDAGSPLLFVRRDRFSSLDAILRSEELVKISETARGGNPTTMVRLVEAVLGEKHFHLVRGYASGRDVAMAVRRGEVDGTGLIKSALKVYLGDMWEGEDIVVIAQIPTPEGKKDPEFPDVPLVRDLAKTDEAKKFAAAVESFAIFWRPVWLPPGVPEKQVQLLREAFWKTVHDEKFLDEAKRMGRPINPTSGDRLQKIWEAGLEPQPEVLKLLQELWGR